MDLYLSSGYDPDDFSVTHLDGVDVAIIDTNALDINLTDKTLIGTIVLKQRLDFENPTDGGENAGDNDYEVALFRVMNATSSNDFKLIVRITDAPDPKKLEILIDSFHLDNINEMRGIREIYLYENSQVMDPLMGDDSNNFLSASLIRGIEPIGERMAFPLANLYDNNDSGSAFVTATTVNSNSNTYHRLNIDFTEEVYIEKVAIRGRQIGGYYGFVFILRDKNDRIIAVHQASNPLSRGSGSDGNSTSTYAFVPDYEDSRFPITNFDIELDNTFFDIIENSTDVILVDNFSVAPGYEYERGFVSIDPGADIDKFNVDNLYFLDNELVGLSFKTAPDAEDEQDADSNNVYEVGMVTITNIEGGHTNFDLAVRVVNVPSTISLYSNAVSYSVNIYTSNIIDDLTEFVESANFENNLNLGRGTYVYSLLGGDATNFKIVGNTLKTVGEFGFRDAFSNYSFQITYTPEGGAPGGTLDVEVNFMGPQWSLITSSASWSSRSRFQTVLLANDDILLLGGIDYNGYIKKDVWSSGDGGENWSLITESAPWTERYGFQTVLLENGNILVMGGFCTDGNIWSSSDGGTNWNIISPPASGSWPTSGLNSFQALALANDNLVVMGGQYRFDSPAVINGDGVGTRNSVYLGRGETSSDWGSSSFGFERSSFQAVILPNNDILAMGGMPDFSYSSERGMMIVVARKDIIRSRDGGRTWHTVTSSAPWGRRVGFQAIVINGDIVVIGGSQGDVWLSRDGGVDWHRVAGIPWGDRKFFQAVVVDNNLIVMGGEDNPTYNRYTDSITINRFNSIWRLPIEDFYLTRNTNY